MSFNYSTDLERTDNDFWTISDGSQVGLDFTNALTLAARVKFESTSGGELRPICAKRDGSNGYLFYLVATNSLQYQTVGLADVSVSWTPSTATWYHIAVTKSGTSVKFYVNGAQQGTTQTLSSGTIPATSAPFQVGSFNSTTDSFDGMIQDLRVWDRELTSGEISSLYSDSCTFDNGSNLQGWWKFDNDATDSSGNGNTLTANASPTFTTDTAFFCIDFQPRPLAIGNPMMY